jgi:DNA-binding HxlR family transcriptional regulator
LTGNTVTGNRNGERSGAQTLALLATTLNVPILRAIGEGTQRQLALRHAVGMPAQTTLRARLRRLERIGAIEKQRHDHFPGALEYELTAAGRDLLVVADAVERWLEQAPGGPLYLGGTAAKAAVTALADGWSTTILRALATAPLSLTELDRIIPSLSYPSLERRLAALRLAGQVEAQVVRGRGTPYSVTQWTREGVGPLTAAAHWERRNAQRETVPIGRIDAEATFLLIAPLLRMSGRASGSCRLAMELQGSDGPRLAGVVIEVEKGRLASCTSRLQGAPDAWAHGPPTAWLEALIRPDADQVEHNGDKRLTRALLGSMHEALFPKAQRTSCNS